MMMENPGRAKPSFECRQCRHEKIQRFRLMSGFTGGSSGASPADTMQLALKANKAHGELAEGTAKAGGAKVVAGAAAAGAIGTAVVLGVIGAPLVGTLAVVGGVAAAGAAAMSDGDAGNAARQAGKATASVTESAIAFDKKNNISGKTIAAGKAGVAKAKEVDKKYSITSTIGSGLRAGWKKAKDADKKYDITGRTGRAASAGLDKVTSALGGDPAKDGNAGAVKDK